MVLPLFTASNLKGLVAGDSYVLSGSEGKHAAVVRRMRLGEGIQLTDGQGLRVLGTITEVLSAEIVLKVSEVVVEERPKIEFTLVQALAKGDRDELAVQAVTELGAMAIIPWQASRSVSRWEGAKAEKGRERWQTIATEAAKQSLRVWQPQVSDVLSTKQLAAMVSRFDLVLVLDPTGEQGLAQLSNFEGSVAIVVGPEGGIEPSELSALEAAGAKRVHLGSGILRTSTAGLAAVSYIAGRSGLWGGAE